MRKISTFLALAAVTLVVVSGSMTQVTAQGGGSIVGEVKFEGAAPAPKVTKVNKDKEACGEEKKSEALVVGPNKGLKNAVVSVVGVKAPVPKPATKPTLD